MISITLLTPVRNGGKFFRETSQNILGQQGDFQLQWRVMDGGSTDGTVDILRSISDPRLAWTSQADGGQSAALNRGLSDAKGDIIGWLNADDLYAPDALETVARTFAARSEVQWLIGRCDMIDVQGRMTRQRVTRYKNRLLDSFSRRLLLRINMISQPAVFWRRSFGQKIGPLDESLHYTMDYDLWLRMAMESSPLILRENLAHFRVHGASKSRGGGRAQFAEGYRVARKHARGDSISLLAHRVNIEKIVWGYRAMKWIGR